MGNVQCRDCEAVLDRSRRDREVEALVADPRSKSAPAAGGPDIERQDAVAVNAQSALEPMTELVSECGVD